MLVKLINRINGVKLGTNIKYKGIPIIYRAKNSNIIIGNNVTIKSRFLSNLIGLYQRTIIITRCPNSIIKIGNNVGVSGATIYAREKIEIGDDTLIGGNVKIIDNDFHPLDVEDRYNDVKEKIKSSTSPFIWLKS